MTVTARLAVAVCVVLLGPVQAARAQAAMDGAVMVLPFDNLRQDPQLAWLREGAAVLLTELLASAGDAAIDRDERLQAFERLQLPAAASLSRASSIKVGQAAGATTLVTGSVEAAGGDLTVRARVIRLDTGRLLPVIDATGPASDLFGVFEKLASQLHVGAPRARWRERLPATPAVFELFIKGLTAESAAAGVAFFDQVLKVAPAFDRARLALWRVHTDEGEHQRAVDAVSSIRPDSPLLREGRFLGALSMLGLRKFDDAAEVLRALQAAEAAAAVANAIGVVELRRTATPAPGRATYYFSQAKDLDPADGDLFFNLGYAYWIERDARAAIYWLREAVRRDPADGDAHFILAEALQRTGAAAEAVRERELATRLSSKYAAWMARATPGGGPVPRGLERLGERLAPAPSRMDALAATAGQRDQEALARFHLDAGHRAFERNAGREAMRELRRALYLSPYLADAHVLMGRVYLREQRANEAIQAFKIALWSEETAGGHAALAEAYLQAGDRVAARAEVDGALALDPESPEALALKARLDGSPW